MHAGEVATRSEVSRKALRLYEAMGILPPAARTAAGYRVYGDDMLQLLGFVTQARRLGFSLAEIRDIISIRRSDRPPCPQRAGAGPSEGGRARPDAAGARRDPQGAPRHARLVAIPREPCRARLRAHRGEEVNAMESVKVSLCPACGACPEVEIREGEVRIGEAGNLAVLKKEEWNVLVELIRSGQLSRI
jgi:DNA-binding transcriptional MerR regulator